MEALIYAGQVSLYAFVFWAFYRLLWQHRPLLNFGRAYILGSMMFALILPLFRFQRPKALQTSTYQVELPAVLLKGSNHNVTSQAISWQEGLLWLYAAVSFGMLLVFIAGLLKTRKRLSRSRTQHFENYSLVTECGMGPGTLGRTIFFPDTEVDPFILNHEIAHIENRHFYDLCLLQVMRVFFWFSPAHWLMGQELKALHEFQADKVAGRGADVARYMNLLLAQSVGCPGPLPIAHFFSPKILKRRIMMLQNRRTPRRMLLLLGTAVFATGFLGTVLFAQSQSRDDKKGAEAKLASQNEYPDVPPQNLRPNYGEVNISGGTINFKIVEKRPEFNGELYVWMQKQLQTKGFNLDDRTPACVIQFVVSETGDIQNPHVRQSSGIPGWDAEVMRVIKLMPAWNPGLQQGKPVAVSVALPVMYNGGGC